MEEPFSWWPRSLIAEVVADFWVRAGHKIGRDFLDEGLAGVGRYAAQKFVAGDGVWVEDQEKLAWILDAVGTKGQGFANLSAAEVVTL